jgi:hypothetical protein
MKMSKKEFLFFPREEELLKSSLPRYSQLEFPLKVPAKWAKNSFIILIL